MLHLQYRACILNLLSDTFENGQYMIHIPTVDGFTRWALGVSAVPGALDIIKAVKPRLTQRAIF
jgi:hypothetical protein